MANKSTLFHPTEIYRRLGVDRSRPHPATFSRVPLCTRLLQNHRDPILLLSRDPSRLVPDAACILQHRLGPRRTAGGRSRAVGAAGEGTPLCFGQHAVAEPPPPKQAPLQLEQQAEGRGRSARTALFGSHRRRVVLAFTRGAA